ncbi:MAG: phenylalanine--tRNA ligase beta subunit-related protein [Nitrososphaerales archaeon]
MKIVIDREVSDKFPDLDVLVRCVRGVVVKPFDEELEKFKSEVCSEVRGKYTLESVKNVAIFRAYRDFFWRLNIDPTKNRPASEALIRRILAGKGLPTINTLVDAYNLASVVSEVALAAFDTDKLQSKEIVMRLAKKGETFHGIGMKEPIKLEGGEVVLDDANNLMAIYPYRDAERSKVTESTKNVALVACGAPNISRDRLLQAADTAVNYVIRFCGGTPSL